MEEHITTDALPGTEAEKGAPAAAGEVAGSDTAGKDGAEQVVEVKDLLKQVLGKEFPDNEAAIKSLKDTFAYVGQMGQKVKTLEESNKELEANQTPAELVEKVATLETQVRDANFYANNPDFNTAEAKALIEKFGGSPEEVVKDEVFQKAFKAITTTAEMEQSQSVLHSNPRLGVVQDNMTKAAEAQKAGNSVAAAEAATAAVLDAFEAKK